MLKTYSKEMQRTMRSYKEEYQYWLDSPALSEEEWKELSAISGDEKEIESRFYAPLEFGTAGLRGVMAVVLKGEVVRIARAIAIRLREGSRGLLRLQPQQRELCP